LQLLYEGLVIYAFNELIINWDNGTQTVFYRDVGENDYWGMHGRDGDYREVFPTISLSGDAVEIEFPLTTTRVYFLYEYGRGVFGDEAFSWSFQTRHGEIQLYIFD
jgi:hypothetical protein